MGTMARRFSARVDPNLIIVIRDGSAPG